MAHLCATKKLSIKSWPGMVCGKRSSKGVRTYLQLVSGFQTYQRRMRKADDGMDGIPGGSNSCSSAVTIQDGRLREDFNQQSGVAIC